MRGNELIFSASGDRRKLYGVSPLLFPQYTVFNAAFLPDDHELPTHGLLTRFMVFDFGFSNPSTAIGPYDSGFFPVQPAKNFLAEVITGAYDVLPSASVPAAGSLSGLPVNPGFLINFQHTHNGNTWQWMNKDVTNVEAVGTGTDPKLFKQPVLIPAGDTLTCVVRNLANASLRVQILLTGASF